jgi:phenylalanyl-tRNA synthetase beta chain
VYRPLPKFPAVTRDLALVCDREIPALRLEELHQEKAPETRLRTFRSSTYTRAPRFPRVKKHRFFPCFSGGGPDADRRGGDAKVKKVLKALQVSLAPSFAAEDEMKFSLT